jgi:pantoate--beta-alanine ligase
MRIIHGIDELRTALPRGAGIALVPTMGNLHAGHLSLVSAARGSGHPVVASIFVNPLQFAPHEDFARYPRTLARDCELLAQAGCDFVFAPSVEAMYPEPQSFRVEPDPALSEPLEGSVRPGFFKGVATVVLKLFHVVEPRVAVFGKKDYQQLRVVESMVRQFNLHITILAGATVRDARGLALSSRNGYLNETELAQAAELYGTLQTVAAAVRLGRTDWQELERTACDALRARGWRPDYVSVRRAADLGEPGPAHALVVLAAARLGATRLIDNLEL